jgi:hypothetical protein
VSEKKMPKGTVHIVPVPPYYINGVPNVPMDVDPETAAEYLSYTPAAFVVADEEPAPEPKAEEQP